MERGKRCWPPKPRNSSSATLIAGGDNFIREKLLIDPRVTYLDRCVGRERGKRHSLPGLDESVGGFRLPGHHAKAFTIPRARRRRLPEPGNSSSATLITVATNFIHEKLLIDPRLTYVDRSVGMERGNGAGCAGSTNPWAVSCFPGIMRRRPPWARFFPDTWNFEWADLRINGQSVGELGIEACYAGHRYVPLIWVQGVAEAVQNIRAGRGAIRQAVAAHDRHPENATMDAAAQRSGVVRLDDHAFEARAGRQAEFVRWLLGTGLDMPV